LITGHQQEHGGRKMEKHQDGALPHF